MSCQIVVGNEVFMSTEVRDQKSVLGTLFQCNILVENVKGWIQIVLGAQSLCCKNMVCEAAEYLLQLA